MKEKRERPLEETRKQNSVKYGDGITIGDVCIERNLIRI